MRLFARLAAWFAHRWPDGEPLVAGGVRYGTRLPDGSVIPAPNTRMELIRCRDCPSAAVAGGIEELNRNLRDLILQLEQERNERRLGGLK